MNRFRHSVFARSFLLPLALLLWLSACHKWVPLEPPVAQAIAEKEPGTVRVTFADGKRVVLKKPRVSGDSLLAYDKDTYERYSKWTEPPTVVVPLDELVTAEEQRSKTLATVGLVIGISAGVPFLIWGISTGFEFTY